MGNPRVFALGRRKFLLVGYISIAEWETYRLLSEQDEDRAVEELIYYSLHRADESITRKRAQRIMRRNRHKLGELVDMICNMSLPSVVVTPPADPPPLVPDEDEIARNTKTTYRLLSRMHGWTPQEISAMSLSQVISYMSGGADGTGVMKMSRAEYRSFRSSRGMN